MAGGIQFDIFNRQEKPSIVLCNPDQTQLFSLGACYDTEINLKWNTQSEFNFVFPQKIGDIEMDAFDYIEGKRLVLIDGLGYFIISEVDDTFDGSVPVKNVSCLSYEAELVYKKLILFTGTYRFYNPDNLEDNTTLIGIISSMIPNWSFGEIDNSLSSLYRTFDVSDTNIYQFLTEDVSTKYNCIFIYDYLNRSISVISANSIPEETDIFLSFNNLIKDTKYSEVTSEITTCLFPYGGNDLSIRSVNPLGTNAIYNFTYYKSINWMSQSLISAINNWENKIELYRPNYESLLIVLSDAEVLITQYEGELIELQTRLITYQQVRSVRIQQGLDTTEIDAMIATVQQEIINKNTQIDAQQLIIDNTNQSLNDINNLLSFSNTDNFTSIQLLELNNFIFESTYQNDSIIVTDEMTFAEIQDQAQSLYDDATTILSRASIPRYRIDISSVNFLALYNFQVFINQLQLGAQITVDSGRGFLFQPTLLEYDYSYDNLDEFSIILSNRQRLDDEHFIFSDLIGRNIQRSRDVDFNLPSWNDWGTTKSIIVGNVVVPTGASEFGLIANNIKGTINARGSVSITNTNLATGSPNFNLDQNGVILTDATLIADGNTGLDLDLALLNGGAMFFRKGIFIGGAGLQSGSIVTVLEDLTGQTGSYITVTDLYLTDSLRVYLNGIMQRQTTDFTENVDRQSFTMYDNVLFGDTLQAEYIALST